MDARGARELSKRIQAQAHWRHSEAVRRRARVGLLSPPQALPVLGGPPPTTPPRAEANVGEAALAGGELTRAGTRQRHRPRGTTSRPYPSRASAHRRAEARP